jgi:hypothetical protein
MMSRDWYKDHSLSPEAYPDSTYLDWAQDNGLYVDAAGNVDYGPPGAAPSSLPDLACPDCGRESCTGEDCYWPDEAGIKRPEPAPAAGGEKEN